MADYIFEEQIDDDLFEDAHLLSIIQTYRDLYEKGEKPTVRHFIHSKDNDIAQAPLRLPIFRMSTAANGMSAQIPKA